MKNARAIRTWFILLGLALLTLGAFWPVTTAGFINLDDPDYVTGNPVVQGGLTLKGIAWAFSTGHAGNWHPAAWISHMLDVQLFGLNPQGHHVVNLLLHVANTLLLFLVLRTMIDEGGRQARPDRKPTSASFLRQLSSCPGALVAALFAVHPLRVESVAWVSERKDVLSTFFFLLTLWAYGRYAAARDGEHRGLQIKTSQQGGKPTIAQAPLVTHGWDSTSIRYVSALAFFTLGLMSKPMLVTLPFVLLLLDYWPLGRLTRPLGYAGQSTGPQSLAVRTLRYLFPEKIYILALTALALVFTPPVEQAEGATHLATEIGPGARLANALVSYVRYLGKAFWPADLTVFYPHPLHWPAWQVTGAAFVLLAITALVVSSAIRNRLAATNGSFLAAAPAAGWFWFLGTLVPVIGLVQVGDAALAERYTYIPLIGIFIMVVGGVHGVFASLEQRTSASPAHFLQVSHAIFGVLAPLIIVALAALTFRQAKQWQSSETLFRHTLAVNPNNALAHNCLGVALSEKGEFKEAEEHFAEALLLRPDFPNAQANYGIALARDGKLEEGINLLTDFLRKFPTDANAHFNLAAAWQQKGDLSRAIEQYRQALRFKPDYADALNNLAWIRAANAEPALRNGTEAVELAQRACELTGYKKPLLLGTLAASYAEAGRFVEAVAMAGKARDLAAASGQKAVAERNQRLLELYQRREAFHEAGK